MMKKILGILLATLILISATTSFAEQLPSPSIQTTVKAQVSLHESGTAITDAGFEVWLEAETEMSAMLLTVIQDFVETEKIAYFFDEETRELSKEYLPENFDIEKLMLAEVYSIYTVGYALEYGDVDAIFEFAADYPDGAILLAMVGVVINESETEEELPEIMWFPIRVVVSEGRVILTIPQEVLELISDNESAYFVLLQAQE